MGLCACIIPARGGSKGVPRKNLARLAGKPLLAWSIEQALASPSVGGRVYVSSDDDEILDVARSYGARAVKRPPELSVDSASSESALLHALDAIESEIDSPLDYAVFLQATSPIRARDDVENAIVRIRAEGADSLLSVMPIRDYFVWSKNGDGARSINFDFRNRKRRQELEAMYLENGSIYVFRPSVLRGTGNRLGGKIAIYEMDKMRSQQIDDFEDLEICERLLAGRGRAEGEVE